MQKSLYLVLVMLFIFSYSYGTEETRTPIVVNLNDNVSFALKEKIFNKWIEENPDFSKKNNEELMELFNKKQSDFNVKSVQKVVDELNLSKEEKDLYASFEDKLGKMFINLECSIYNSAYQNKIKALTIKWGDSTYPITKGASLLPYQEIDKSTGIPLKTPFSLQKINLSDNRSYIDSKFKQTIEDKPSGINMPNSVAYFDFSDYDKNYNTFKTDYQNALREADYINNNGGLYLLQKALSSQDFALYRLNKMVNYTQNNGPFAFNNSNNEIYNFTIDLTKRNLSGTISDGFYLEGAELFEMTSEITTLNTPISFDPIEFKIYNGGIDTKTYQGIIASEQFVTTKSPHVNFKQKILDASITTYPAIGTSGCVGTYGALSIVSVLPSDYFKLHPIDISIIGPGDYFYFYFPVDAIGALFKKNQKFTRIIMKIELLDGTIINQPFDIFLYKNQQTDYFDIKDKVLVMNDYTAPKDIEFVTSQGWFGSWTTNINGEYIPDDIEYVTGKNYSENPSTLNINAHDANPVNSREISGTDIDGKMIINTKIEKDIARQGYELINDSSNFYINLGSYLQFKNYGNEQEQNIYLNITKRENNGESNSITVSNNKYIEDKVNFSLKQPTSDIELVEKYKIAEYTIEYRVGDEHKSTPDYISHLLLILLPSKIPVFPIIDSFSPKYFKKNLKSDTENSLTELPLLDKYSYFGMRNYYGIDHYNTAKKNYPFSNSVENTSEDKTPIIKLYDKGTFNENGETLITDPFKNNTTFDIKSTKNSKTKISVIKDSNATYRLTLDSIKEYQNRNTTDLKDKVTQQFILYSPMFDFHKKGELNFGGEVNFMQSYIDNLKENTILCENLDSTENSLYRMWNDGTKTDSEPEPSDFYVGFNLGLSKKMTDERGINVIPSVSYNLNVDNTTSLKGEEFSQKYSDIQYLSTIDEYTKTITGGAIDFTERKVNVKNCGILDSSFKYTAFTNTFLFEPESREILLALDINWITNGIVIQDSFPIKLIPVSTYKIEIEENPISVFKDANKVIDKNFFTFGVNNFNNNIIQEAQFVKNLYDTEQFDPNNNNAVDSNTAANPDFYSRLGDSFQLTPFFKDSLVIPQKNKEICINKFFMINQKSGVGQGLSISFNKEDLFNLEQIELPGYTYNNLLPTDEDNRFLLSSTNYKLFQYFKLEPTTEYVNYEKIILGKSEVPKLNLEDMGNKYIFEDEQKKTVESDNIWLNKDVEAKGESLYFKNQFSINSLSNSRWMEVIEPSEFYMTKDLRLSKIITDGLATVAGEQDVIKHQASNPYDMTESLILNFDNISLSNKITKEISTDYSLNNKSVETLPNFVKNEINYYVTKMSPEVTNIYKVSPPEIKQMVDEKESDVSKNSMIELAMHGRIYAKNSIYMVDDSEFRKFYKMDYFNLSYLNNAYNNLQQKDIVDLKKYFTDINFEYKNEIENPDTTKFLVKEDIQTQYENATKEQDKKTIFFTNYTEEEIKGSEQKSYLSETVEDKNSELLESMNYDKPNEAVNPFSIMFIDKISMKYGKYDILNSYSSIPDTHQINAVLTDKGTVHHIPAVDALKASYKEYYNEKTGENEKVTSYLELSQTTDTKELEKYSPITFALNETVKYYDRKTQGKSETKEYRLVLKQKNENKTETVFSNFSDLFNELIEPSYESTESNYVDMADKVDSFTKEEADNQLFSNIVYAYTYANNEINFESETKISSGEEDLFKMFPKDQYKFLPSNTKFKLKLSKYFKENNFIRSSVGHSLSYNVIPVQKVNLTVAEDENNNKIYQYYKPDMKQDFGKEVYEKIEFTNMNDSIQVKKMDYTDSEIVLIKNKLPIYTNPFLNTTIKLKEEVSLKDKFDIFTGVDFREDFSKNFNYAEETIDISKLNVKKINGKILFNGELYQNASNITYKNKIYTPLEGVSSKKELLSGKIVDGDKYLLYKEQDTDSENSSVYYKGDTLRNITPITYLDEIKIYRRKQNTNSDDLLLTIYCNKYGGGSTGNLINNEIYLRTSSGLLKSDADIMEELLEIPVLKENFEGIEVNRIKYKMTNNTDNTDEDLNENKDYIYSLSIRGIQMTTELFGNYIKVKAISKMGLNDDATLNKSYLITAENEKKMDINVRKY